MKDIHVLVTVKCGEWERELGYMITGAIPETAKEKIVSVAQRLTELHLEALKANNIL